jgi:predicted MFS family arabinose efflux permease
VSFFVFGCVGVIWSILWFSRFRDNPTGSAQTARHRPTPWHTLLCSRNLWAIMALTFGYVYTMSFYQTWFHTYLVKGRGFSEQALSLSALPYVCGAAANLLGGFGCDRLASIVGMKWSRRGVGMAGLALAAVSIACAAFTTSHLAVILCLSLAYVGITFQQPAVFSACLDIGGPHGGLVCGFMNTAGQFGGAISSAIFGYAVKATGSYQAPLIPMAAFLTLGMLLWTKVDVTAPIGVRTVDAGAH